MTTSIPKKAIKELQKIIKKDYGKKISMEHAAKLGHSLLRLSRVGLSALARSQKSKHEKI